MALIVLVHLVFSYYYFPRFFSSMIGTGLIILFAYLAWHKDFKYWIGLQISKKEVLITIFVFLFALTGSLGIIKLVAAGHQIRFYPGNYKNCIHTLFYTLNEEIILGALLLKGIQHFAKKAPDWFISVCTAFIFAIIHFVFFKWIFRNTGNLDFITMLSLFAVGIIRNNLILRTGHIGYSWALHFAWIYVMLGSSHFDQTQNVFLTDFERFQVYLGDFWVLNACLLLVILSFLKLKKSTN